MTGSKELKLPRLIGSRSTVRALLAELGDIRDRDVILNARDLRSASPSSADEFVKVVLVDRRAARLRVTNSGPDFIEDLETAARERQVQSKLVTPSLK